MARAKTTAAAAAAAGPACPDHRLVKLCIGDRVFGKGATEAEAVRNASKEAGFRLKGYNLYLVHPDAYVSDMGSIRYPEAGPRPVFYKKVRDGKEAPIAEAD